VGFLFTFSRPKEYLISGAKIKYLILFSIPIPKSMAKSGLFLKSVLDLGLLLSGSLKFGPASKYGIVFP
jgi:hypothetical protein